MIKADPIAEKLRQMLVTYGLEIVYANGQVKFFEERRRLHSSMPGKAHERKAAEAKLSREAYATYAENLAAAKRQVEDAIKSVIGLYSSVQKKVWYMVFIEQKSHAEVMEETHYSERTLKRIIAQMRADMAARLEIEEEMA